MANSIEKEMDPRDGDRFIWITASDGDHVPIQSQMNAIFDFLSCAQWPDLEMRVTQRYGAWAILVHGERLPRNRALSLLGEAFNVTGATWVLLRHRFDWPMIQATIRALPNPLSAQSGSGAPYIVGVTTGKY